MAETSEEIERLTRVVDELTRQVGALKQQGEVTQESVRLARELNQRSEELNRLRGLPASRSEILEQARQENRSPFELFGKDRGGAHQVELWEALARVRRRAASPAPERRTKPPSAISPVSRRKVPSSVSPSGQKTRPPVSPRLPVVPVAQAIPKPRPRKAIPAQPTRIPPPKQRAIPTPARSSTRSRRPQAMQQALAASSTRSVYEQVREAAKRGQQRVLGFVRHARSLSRGAGRNLRRQLLRAGRGARKLLPMATRAPLATPTPAPTIGQSASSSEQRRPSAVSQPKVTTKPPTQTTVPASAAKQPLRPQRFKQADAKFQRAMQHGPKPIPTAKPVRLKQAQAAFLHRQQHGIPTAKPLPIAKAVRLKQREANFQEQMRHGKPRHAPPVGATWERKPTNRHKRADWLFQNKHERKSAAAAAIKGMVSPSSASAPGKTGQPLSSGGDTLMREGVELLRRLVNLMEARANEGKQRDTGQLPPSGESVPEKEEPLSGRMAHAAMSNFGGHDPVGNAMKAVVKEAMRETVRRGIAALMI